MRISTVGVDLAKNIFQLHAETADGQVVLNRALPRGQVLAFFERLEPGVTMSEQGQTRIDKSRLMSASDWRK